MNHTQNHWFRLVLIGAVLVAAVFSLARPAGRTAQAQTGGTLGYGSKVYGTLSAAAPLVTYSFSGNSGDFVAITADTWTGALDPQIDLVAPNGLVLEQGSQNTPAADPVSAYLSVFLPDAGAYLVRLSGENGTTGDFLLTLVGRSATTATPLVYGQAVDVTVAQNAPPQFFSFETEDCPTTLVVTNPGQGEPFTFPFVVKVRDQRGHTVALLRGGEQTEDWVTVQPNSGRYEVEVLAADPSLTGSIRLLVTCSGDNPGCPAGQAGIAGIPGAGCVPCPGPGDQVPGGGCPDLHLAAGLDATVPGAVKVVWDAMPGADGYTVRVTGITTDGGEVYLTHADWSPGDPTVFTWILPVEGYSGYQFTLEVLAEGSIICTQQVQIPVEQTSPDCPDLGLNGVVTDESVNAVALSWAAGLGADQFDLDMYAIISGAEEYGGRLVLPGDATSRAFDHFPPHLDGVRFVLWMWREGRLCSNEITVMFEGIPGQQFTCDDFSLSVAASTGSQVDLVWSAYPGADGYVYLLMDAARNPVPGHSVIMGPTQLNLVLVSPPIAPGTYTASIGPWDDVTGGFCAREVTFTLGSPNELPCAIRTDQGDVPVSVGPGPERSVFTYLPPGEDILVVGQAVGSDGNPWWEINKAQIPGGDAAISLWVAQSDVTTVGNCTQIPQVEVPPVIPEEEGGPPPGGWGPCGSCDSCGHAASECVTSPDGQCLWDPATCLGGPPPSGGGGCYAIRAAIDMGNCYGGGSAMIDTVPNCEGGQYLPGTSMQAHAVAVDPKCVVKSWSGCGASGSGSSVSFTATGSCTATAHMGY
ncbi:MAG TPA: hypothetical protein VMT24_20130 [Aggregatilineaceae bacterium]|nr:hypothetical protein [Aggregatilineaceae bacterium]